MCPGELMTRPIDRDDNQPLRPASAPSVALLLVLLFPFLLLGTPAPLLAQSPGGSVAGVVSDQSGGVVRRAAVDLIAESGLSRTTIADDDGRYEFRAVPPGRYRLVAIYEGFAPLIKEDVDVGDSAVDVPLGLQLGRAEATVMVTASTRPQEIRDVQASAQVVSSDELRAFAGNSVTEGLKLAAGVDARSSGANSSVSIRGFTSSGGLLILADGLRRTAKYGSTNLNLFELEAVDRVEIIRGPMSALHGADATGGVINVVSRPIRRSATPTGSARFQTGSMTDGQRPTFVEGASMEFGTGDTGHRISVEQRNRGLFRVDPATITADLNRVNQTFIDYQGEATLPAFRSLRWSLEAVRQGDTGPGLLAAAPPTRPTAQPFEVREQEQRYFGALHYAGTMGRGALQIDAGYGRSNGETTRSYPTIEATRFGQTQAQGRYYIAAGPHSLVIGAGLIRDAISISNFLSTSPTRTNTSLLVQDEWRLTPHLNLLIGLRGDHFTDFGSVATPRGSLLFKRGSLNLRAGYGQAYRAPTVTEQYSSFLRGRFLITGNPGLKPEINHTWEVAASLRRGGVQTEAVYFDSHVDDLIQSVTQPRQAQDPASVSLRSVYSNVATARLRGVELTSTWQASRLLALTGAWDYLDATDRSTGARLTARARSNARGALRFEYRRWRIDLRGRQYIDFYAADPNSRTGPAFNSDYGTVDFKAEFKLSSTVSLSAGLDNVRSRRQPINFSSMGAIIEPPARYGYAGARVGF